MSSLSAFNILKLMQAIGEEGVRENLSGFSCEKNLEIELFVKNKALDFAKRKMSITYIVIDGRGEIAAIFTLTHKAVQIPDEQLSSTKRKKILRHAQLDASSGSYLISAFLIAQFAKNSSYSGEPISGNDLMRMTEAVLRQVQQEVGGSVVYLECEEKESLLKFYQSEPNCFQIFDERYSLVDNTKYIQLFKFI